MSDDSKRDELVGALFQGDWNSDPATGFARTAARAARRRRWARIVLGTAGTAGLLAALVVQLHSPPIPATSVAHPTTSAPYEIISDEELLAQVTDRPLLAVRDGHGRSEIVVLTN